MRFYKLCLSLWLFLSLCILFNAASCRAEEGELVFILKGRGNIFWQVINTGIREAAAANKVKALLYNTDDDQSAEAQLNICLAALARKPKIIIMGAATKTIGIECYKKPWLPER
jgi:ABC-type sugar transport system substrate-binding protein